MISVHKVNPDTGLFDDPIMPDQIAGHRGEEKAQDNHDQRRNRPASQHPGEVGV